MPTDRAPEAVTRRSLLSRLKNWDDARSWQDFFDTYWKLIYRAATRAGLNDAEAQDTVQEVIIAVARRMPKFRYDPAIGSFKNWLLQITRHKIQDHLRRYYRHAKVFQPNASPELPGRVPNHPPPAARDEFEKLWDAEWEANLMEAALHQLRQSVDARQFQIFDCYVLKEWPVQDVVRTLQVTENQVYLAKSRLSALLRKECARLQQEML